MIQRKEFDAVYRDLVLGLEMKTFDFNIQLSVAMAYIVEMGSCPSRPVLWMKLKVSSSIL